MRRLVAVGAMFFALGLVHFGTQSVLAQPAEGGNVILQADSLTYDRDQGVVRAAGNVEISQGRRVLRADAVTFNERTGVIVATGNVALLEPTGEVMFAEYAELTDDMKEGFIRGFRMLLQDDSRLAAASGRRQSGVRSELDRAVFSPCNLCPQAPQRAPLWQVKAAKVVHDNEAHDIVYRDAWFELFGVPVLYTPYLSHPDPTVDRRSGFLAPTLGVSTDLGTLVRVPYYWAISPDKDLTFDPLVTTDGGVVLGGEYRQRFDDGEWQFKGTATRDAGNNPSGETRSRGHVDSFARFDIDDTWRAGAKMFLTSDDTYLKRYGLSEETTLTNRVFAEGFWRRSYALAEGYYFQGLRSEDVQGRIPLVLPKLDFNYLSEPQWRGGRMSFDGNLLMLTRSDGTDTGRVAMNGGWHQSFEGLLGGDRIKLDATLELDTYRVTEGANPPQDSPQDGTFFRMFPQLALEWSYPFVRHDGGNTLLIEPVAGLVLSPNGGNGDEFPNEDSRNFELDDTNIMSPSRFPGRDRVDGGQRINYGLRANWYGPGPASASAFVGQSFRLRIDDTFAVNSGVERHLSDLVGRVTLSPNKYLDATYRTRFSEQDWTARRNEVQINAGPQAFRGGLDYLFYAGVGEFEDREEITGRFRSKLTDYWAINGSVRHNLAGDAGLLGWGVGVDYKDECVDLSFTFNRSFTYDRDVPTADTILLRVTLKYLGEIQQQFY